MANRRKNSWAPEAISLPEGVNHALVALSGGADSVYLLYALLSSGARVSAAHFHHGLRGESADRDRDFCRELCGWLNVPFYEGGAEVSAYAKLEALGVESAARVLRYRFLRNVREGIGADVIALGHHMDDQAETVLMHLLRGSGLRGAGGMSEREGDLYRPLLGLTKAQIVNRLVAGGVEWREDETNAVCDNPRNALRNLILPRIAEIYPGANQALSRFAQIAREDGAMLDELARRERRERAHRLPNGWRVEGVNGMPEPLLRRVLMDLTGVRDMQRLCAMVEIAKSAKKRADFGKLRLEPNGENLYIIDVDFCVPGEAPFASDGVTALDGLCRMTAEPSAPEPILSGGMAQVLHRRALSGAVLRTRRKGDRIHPLGAAGAKLLSDYLIDRKVPRAERDFLPLLARGDEVLWVVGVGVSEAARVYPGADAVKICCEMAEVPEA
ncbi:MAG: tRNA lysidine(34) synthetase TilS [Clostridia bacterium]|nr:tRNA lysidine(34) synthetase TilS [Clostridia bacterium]